MVCAQALKLKNTNQSTNHVHFQIQPIHQIQRHIHHCLQSDIIQNKPVSAPLISASHQNSMKYVLKSVTGELVFTNMRSGFVDNFVG